jgi:hypothetical protein
VVQATHHPRQPRDAGSAPTRLDRARYPRPYSYRLGAMSSSTCADRARYPRPHAQTERDIRARVSDCLGQARRPLGRARPWGGVVGGWWGGVYPQPRSPHPSLAKNQRANASAPRQTKATQLAPNVSTLIHCNATANGDVVCF